MSEISEQLDRLEGTYKGMLDKKDEEIERLKQIIVQLAAAVEDCEPDLWEYGPLVERARGVAV